MHKSRTNKTLKKHPLRSPLPLKPQTATSLKKNPPKRHFPQSLLKREEDRLYRTTFVDTSDRDIILKQKLGNITAESENKN